MLVIFIAEAGINHNGDIDLAKKLIDIAYDAGADVVKFQKRTPEACVPEFQKNQIRSTPWGDMTYLEYKKRMEFGKKEYDEIDRYCKKKGIRWTASVWDIYSVDFIAMYDVPFIKIPSACITDKELLRAVNGTGKPVILSCGMSTLDELDYAIGHLDKDTDISILHCNSSYPAADNELDLRAIQMLKKRYPYRIGYSGHEEGIGASIVATALGAEIIEKHITLDKRMWGTDHASSLVYNELAELIENIRKVPVWMGKDSLICYPSEEKAKKKLRR